MGDKPVARSTEYSTTFSSTNFNSWSVGRLLVEAQKILTEGTLPEEMEKRLEQIQRHLSQKPQELQTFLSDPKNELLVITYAEMRNLLTSSESAPNITQK